MIEVKASLCYLRLSPHKVRQVVRLLKGKSVLHALRILEIVKKRPSQALKKLIKSAMANASLKYQGIEPQSLFIKELYVNEGPKLKRARPKAFGRVAIIRRRSCHIHIVLSLL
jgi:large subunit ribosomal protein L22